MPRGDNEVGLEKGRSHATSTSMLVKGDEGGAAKGMAARSRGVVEMMTRTTTNQPRRGIGRTWSVANSGKKKKKTGAWQALGFFFLYIHIYSHSHMEVHTSRNDGEKA